MSARKAKCGKAKPTVNAQLLDEAARLLHITHAAFHTDLCDEPGPREVRTAIQAAARSLLQWFDDNAAGAPRGGIYDVLSILVLMDMALATAVDFPEDQHCDPIRTALGVVRDLLERFIADPLEEPHHLRARLASPEVAV